eukprot:1280508-Amorphochlora_amoeboformis.AAC.1
MFINALESFDRDELAAGCRNQRCLPARLQHPSAAVGDGARRHVLQRVDAVGVSTTYVDTYVRMRT